MKQIVPTNMVDFLQVFAWPKIKPAVRVKLESIIEDFNLAMPEDQVGLLQQMLMQLVLLTLNASDS